MIYSLGLFVTLQDGCNLDCSFCQFPLRKEFRTGNKIDYDRFVAFLDNKYEATNCKLSIPIGAVSFCGSGEPLLYDRIVDIIQETKKRIPFVSLVTNGVLMNKELGEKILEAGVDHIVFSITGNTESTYSEFQGSGKKVVDAKRQFEIVRKNISDLVCTRNKMCNNTQIGISYLLDKKSQKDYFDALYYWRSIGVNYVDTRMLQCGFSYKENDFEQYVKQHSRWWTDNNCCTCFGKVMNVFTDGRISMCNNVEEEQIVGNIYEQSISEIINSEKFLNTFQCVTKDYLNMPEICKTCDMLRARPILT